MSADCAVCGATFTTPALRGWHERRDHPGWTPSAAMRQARMEESRARYAARQSRSVAFLRNSNIRARRVGRPIVDLAMVLPDGPCTYCGGPSDTWDHVVPFGQGGETSPENLTPTCHACNHRKSRYGAESATFRGPFLCGWCWTPVHRSRSKAFRHGRDLPWFACSASHANILRRWGLAFGNPLFAGSRTALEALA